MKKIIACLAMISIAVTTVCAETVQMVCSEYPPYEYTDENGKIRGFSVEILRAMLTEMKIKDNIRVLPWKRAYHTALNQKNTLLFSTVRTEARESLFQWIGPINSVVSSLYKLRSRTDIKVKTLNDAKKIHSRNCQRFFFGKNTA